MRTKNHIKAPQNDTLRGTGKLGWSESSAVHSTVKRLVSTFDPGDTFKRIAKAKKIKVTCPQCGANFSNREGKVRAHTISVNKFNDETKEWYNVSEQCSQKPRWNNYRYPTKVSKCTVGGETYKVGQTVFFARMNTMWPGVTRMTYTYFEGPIQSIAKKDDGSFIIYLPQNPEKHGRDYFELNENTAKNIIKVDANPK